MERYHEELIAKEILSLVKKLRQIDKKTKIARKNYAKLRKEYDKNRDITQEDLVKAFNEMNELFDEGIRTFIEIKCYKIIKEPLPEDYPKVRK